MTQVAVTDGSWVLLGVMLVLLAGVVYGFYTRGGSGIDRHPIDGRGQAPGAAEDPPQASNDHPERSSLSSHGAK